MILIRNKKISLFIKIIIIAIVGVSVYSFFKSKNNNIDNKPLAATPVAISSDKVNAMPHDTTGLGGYNVLIADRGNNRIIEVTPDKKIVWEHDFNLPKMGLGADDAFFTDGGKTLSINLEEYHVIQLLDYATQKVIWSYGTSGKPGSDLGFLNTPDDAYKLPNGDIIVADIKNCRIIEISPNKKIVRQYGKTRVCGSADGLLSSPNGDTPLPNGHILISNIGTKKLIELDSNWKKIFEMPLPVKYPSDPQMTQAGNILISDYSNPGKIVEVSKTGNIVWEYTGDGTTNLNKPSLAIELPNGNIMANDDMNHRVIVIDKQTKKIVWQYGITGKPGRDVDQLDIPDGMDIIMRNATSSTATTVSPAIESTITQVVNTYKIGQVSRHPTQYVNKNVNLTGYVIKKENSYAIFSDEANGTVGFYDLPVSGAGISNVVLNKKYILDGILKYKGLTAINKNPYHLELSNPPQIVN